MAEVVNLLQIRTSSDTVIQIEYAGQMIDVKPMSSSAQTRLQKKHTKKDKLNTDAYLEEKFQLQVIGWPNTIVSAETGEPLPCNTENKKLFYQYNNTAALEILAKINEIGAEEVLADEKN